MGTRSNTIVIETGYDKPIVLLNLYRQFDGYLSWHGKELSKFIGGISLCNGIGETKGFANGAGCFAAQLVAHFKKEAGGFYIEPPKLQFDNDFTYVIRIDTFNPSKGFEIEVRKDKKQIFKGRSEEFAAFIAKEKS